MQSSASSPLASFVPQPHLHAVSCHSFPPIVKDVSIFSAKGGLAVQQARRTRRRAITLSHHRARGVSDCEISSTREKLDAGAAAGAAHFGARAHVFRITRTQICEHQLICAPAERHCRRKGTPRGIGTGSRLNSPFCNRTSRNAREGDFTSYASSSAQRSHAVSAFPPSDQGLQMAGDELAKVDEVNSKASSTVSSAFLGGLMPKKEIRADRFLESHPSYDGRNVTIAILDSGVDPAAAGLQITPDGKPKIIDVLDCTGSGDVDTSTIVKADDEGFLPGASGRRVQINKDWKNPSGNWHVGYKFVYQLFTESLVSRVKKERKKKWTEAHLEAVTIELRQLRAFDVNNPKVSETSLKKEREDLQTRYDLLQQLSDNHDDNGPIIDAVVWHDGDVWRVALDTQDLESFSGSGKLADFTPLTNYRIERKHGTFSRLDACTFVTNVYDDGNVLSIVTDSSAHGTHVAGITAAYHPEEPLLNGVAPGAQLISCKIGDSRLVSMETGTGLTRALIAVIQNKCDMINMSYGEPTMIPNYGRFVELSNEAVNKHGVIFISSAGNNGPSLSTVTAPGGTTSCIVGIGAYVSPAMASAAHSVVQPPAEGLPYTWSSRGPTPDGDLGVSLSAPGGAVAPVPKWTLQGRMLMNGTSMASPCACGGVALILSALKAEEQAISPHLVRAALENTAAKLGDIPEEPLTTGHGLLQVDLAYEYLQKCKERPSILYKVHVNRSGASEAPLRGVYLREVHDSRQASEWSITVKPEFHEDADKMDFVVPFEERLQLRSSNPSWLKCPEYLLLTHNGRTFNVVVDPTQLKDGVHYAEVSGSDLEAPWRGPSFRVPVTVIKPTELSPGSPEASFRDLSFTPGHTERRFVVVPEGATWAELTVKVHGFDIPRRFFLNAIQLASRKRPSGWESVATFTSPSSKVFTFPVESGLTMEITMALFWSSANGSDVPAHADVLIEFHGIQASDQDMFINGNEALTRVDVKAPLATEKLAPSATLTRIRVPYRPMEVKIEPLSADRDKLSNGRQIHALTSTYKFSLAEGAEITPRLSYLNRRIYDTEFESQFYMIFDANKRLFASGDVYPKAVRLPKGDYMLRLFIRHDNVGFLEKLKKTPILLERKLEDKNQIKLSFYSHIDGPITGAEQLKSKLLSPGEIQPVYFGSVADDKLPKDAVLGTVLVGKLKWGKLSWASTKGHQKGQECPAWSPVSYVVPAPVKAEEKPKEKGPEEKKSVAQRVEEEVREAKIKLLSSLPISTTDERKEWDDFARSLKADYPKHLQLKVEILQKLSTSKDEDTAEIIHAAEEVISLIDKDALAKYFGVKSDTDDPSSIQLKKDMDAQRDALANALYKKGLALSEEQKMVTDDQARPAEEATGKTNDGTVGEEEKAKEMSELESSQKSRTVAGGGEGTIVAMLSAEPEENNGASAAATAKAEAEGRDNDEFEKNYLEFRKWVDVMSLKYVLLTIRREKRAGRIGSAIKALNELIQDDNKPPQKQLYEQRIKLIESAGWTHWASYEKKWLHVRFPSSYPLF